jgi:hypothetical protein
MTPDEKADLRDMRDECPDEEDKKLLRKAINYIQTLETRLSTVRTLLKTAMNEANSRGSNHD